MLPYGTGIKGIVYVCAMQLGMREFGESRSPLGWSNELPMAWHDAGQSLVQLIIPGIRLPAVRCHCMPNDVRLAQLLFGYDVSIIIPFHYYSIFGVSTATSWQHYGFNTNNLEDSTYFILRQYP